MRRANWAGQTEQGNLSRTNLEPEKSSHECWQANKQQHNSVDIPRYWAKDRQNELKSTNSTLFEKKSSIYGWQGKEGGRGGGLPEPMVHNTLSASRKDNRQQNSPSKITESPQAMLLKHIGHKPLLVSRNSRRMQYSLSCCFTAEYLRYSLNEKAKVPEAMVSKRLLASCSLVLLDLGRPTAAHCDCSSTYTEQPEVLLWMWQMAVANGCGPHAKFVPSEI